jgi:glycosyltransferase involved in cell wall biosynthesis
MADGLRGRGWTVDLLETDPIVHPLGPPLDSASAEFAAIPDNRVVLVDGLVFGSMPEIAERHGRRLRFVPIVHMPLAKASGLTPGEAGWASNLERRALEHARHIVVTGHGTLPLISGLGGRVEHERMTVILPGTDRRSIVRPPRDTALLHLLCIANLTAGKGHDIVLRALATISRHDWRLTCVGSDARDPATAAAIRMLAADLRLEPQVEFTGELDEGALDAQYRKSDLFVLATRGETYGMAAAEAISYGLPVVSTRTGEIPWFADGASVLVEPGDQNAFARALGEVMMDESLRQRLRAGAEAAAQRLPTWDIAVEQLTAVIERVAA